MEQRHIPPAGEWFIGNEHVTGSNAAECPCKPQRRAITKAASTGRGGRHQGYNVIRIEWRHNPLTEAATPKQKEEAHS